jgi:type VI secretion system secreted protein VgrG
MSHQGRNKRPPKPRKPRKGSRPPASELGVGKYGKQKTKTPVRRRQTQRQRPSTQRNVTGCQTCNPPVQQIEAVEWLHGNQTDAVTRDTPPAAPDRARQYVNLTPDGRWPDLDEKVPNSDRVSHRSVRARVRFKEPRSESFQWRLWRFSDHGDVYSADEKARRGNYVDDVGDADNGAGEWQSGRTDDQGVGTIEVDLVAGGGFRYVLAAKDEYGHQAVRSDSIETWRRLYLQTLIMSGANTMNLGPLVRGIVSEFAKHYIDVKLFDSKDMGYINVVGEQTCTDVDLMWMVDNAYKESDAPQYEPYVAILVWGHRGGRRLICKFRSKVVNLDRSRKTHKVTFSVEEEFGDGMMAWDAFYDEKDWVKGVWWEEAEFAPWGENKTFELGRKQLKPIVDKANPHVLEGVEVNLSKYAPGAFSRRGVRTGRVTVSVPLASVSAGSAFGNAVVVFPWKISDYQVLESTVIHEFGHYCSLVPNPDAEHKPGRDLDAAEHYYDEHGHVGPHCHCGIDEPLPDDFMEVDWEEDRTDRPGCVMYGDVDGYPPSEFCAACAKALRKTDLGDGKDGPAEWFKWFLRQKVDEGVDEATSTYLASLKDRWLGPDTHVEGVDDEDDDDEEDDNS